MEPPVLGRESPAAASEPVLGVSGDASSAGWRAAGGSWGSYTVRAATVSGVRHRLAGERDDDSFAWARGEECLALAVADGLGSVAGSREAAAVASTVAVAAAVAAVDSGARLIDAVEEAIRAANRALTRPGSARLDSARAGASPDAGAPPDAEAPPAGASTIVVAVLDGAGRCAFARVGDSSAMVVTDDAEWAEVFDAPDTDRVGTETDALPLGDEDIAEIIVVAEEALGPDDIVVLASDGVADPWRDGPTTVSPTLVEALLDVPSPLEMLRLADFSRQGCHDDRTLACVWWRGG